MPTPRKRRSARQDAHVEKRIGCDEVTVAPRPVGVSLQPCASLAELCSDDDIWATVCSWLPGDALCCVAHVSRLFRCATCRTPAYVLLAGINNDAQVVPWGCPENVLTSQYQHHRCTFDREYLAIRAAEDMLRNVVYPDYLQHKRQRHHLAYVGSGPSRPPSPSSAASITYDPYVRPAYCEASERLLAPVFGVRAGFSYAPFWDVLVGSSDSSDVSDTA
jgi:hypothetical protein